MYWQLKNKAEDLKLAFLYFKRKILLRKKIRKDSINILFIVGYTGKSGGNIAISSIANLLAEIESFEVKAIFSPTSYLNVLLSKKIGITNSISNDVDILITDLSADPKLYSNFPANKIITSIHGFKDILHGLQQSHIDNVLSVGQHIHFVSEIQQDSYKLDIGRYFVIPNTTNKIFKSNHTYNIGCVGNLDERRKRAKITIIAGQASNAKEIHLWSTSNQEFQTDKVHLHDWEKDKEKIFNSFDVLVFLSEFETFGLVVIEAMSAGIPCVLSDIPAFRQFSNCEGVVIHDFNDIKGIEKSINKLLAEKESLKPHLISFYDKNYSLEHCKKQWHETILRIIDSA